MSRGAAKGSPPRSEVLMDDQLNAQWAADVAASDPQFVLAVMARIEQRRFCRELAVTAGLAAAAMALLALVMPAGEVAWRERPAPHIGNLAILTVLGAVTLLLPQLFPARD